MPAIRYRTGEIGPCSSDDSAVALPAACAYPMAGLPWFLMGRRTCPWCSACSWRRRGQILIFAGWLPRTKCSAEDYRWCRDRAWPVQWPIIKLTRVYSTRCNDAALKACRLAWRNFIRGACRWWFRWPVRTTTLPVPGRPPRSR